MRTLRVIVVLALAAILVAAAAFVTVRPFRIAVLTAALVPELLDKDPKLLSAFVPGPTRLTVSYGADGSLMDIYLPAGGVDAGGAAAAGPGTGDDAGRVPTAIASGYPVVVFVLGVNPVPRDHPAVVRTAQAIARLGLAVTVPESPAMRTGQIRAAEPHGLVEVFEALAGRPEIDRDRIGFAGFSAGGSVALVAAADPEIAGRVAYVNAFGAWADPETFLVDIVTRSMALGNGTAPWSPGELTRTTYLQLALGFVDDPSLVALIRDRLAPSFAGEQLPERPTFDPAIAAALHGDALVVYQLSTAPDRATAEEALGRLSPIARATLDGLSPVAVAPQLRAPIYLMHDQGDTAIPYSHLERLAAAVPPDVLQRATLFALFDHVQPREGIDPAALPEFWKLAWHLQAVMDRALP